MRLSDLIEKLPGTTAAERDEARVSASSLVCARIELAMSELSACNTYHRRLATFEVIRAAVGEWVAVKAALDAEDERARLTT